LIFLGIFGIAASESILSISGFKRFRLRLADSQALALTFVPSSDTLPGLTRPASRQSRKERFRETASLKATDNSVVGQLACRDGLVGNVITAMFFKTPTGTLTGTVRISQLGDHQRWLKSRVADTINAIFPLKRREINLLDCIENKPGQIIILCRPEFNW
jgi:hypothetical protein